MNNKEQDNYSNATLDLIKIRLIKIIMNYLSEYIALEEECVHKALLGY